jgi:hypothetical protein
MKHRLVFSSLPFLALFLVLVPTALASSTWYVAGVNGSDNNNCESAQTACKTIGHAIKRAASGDVIIVAAATYTESLTIKFNLSIVGSRAQTAIIDGGASNTVVTILGVQTHVGLANLTIRNGKALIGGGINNAGILSVTNSIVSGNHVTGYRSAGGGGVYNAGRLRISGSTISGNSARSGLRANGGGIANQGTLYLVNSTVFGNYAVGGLLGSTADGGGVSNSGNLTVSSTTFAGNTAEFYCLGNPSRSCIGRGGGVYTAGLQAVIQNSIIVNYNPFGDNCYGNLTSLGYNLSSDNSCNFNGTGDRQDTDPMLGPLQNNGGPTQTMALSPGSPAIDAGNPSGCTDGNGHLLKTDQRGMPRPDKEDSGGCDMGAYERQSD